MRTECGLGEPEQMTLMAILQREGDAHGPNIQRELLDRGWRPRRYMQVTISGIQALRDARSAWRRLLEGLEGILGES